MRGEELVGLEYEGPFDDLAAQEGIVHRIIPWNEVSLDEGTGIVHIAPGAGAEDFELSRVHDLPVLTPIDESGVMLPEYGRLAGKTTDQVVVPVIESLRERGRLVEATSIVHRYPVCWRCSTPLVFRVVDDWFISAEEIRQPMLDRERDRRVDPAAVQEADGRLATQHGRLEHLSPPLLRPAAPVLRVRVRAPQPDRLTRGARSAGGLGPRPAAGAPSTVDRRRPHPLRGLRRRGRADPRGRRRVARRGHRPLLHAWLAEPRMDLAPVRDRSIRRDLGRRPSRPRLLGEVVPGGLGHGDARADPALVLLPMLHGDHARRPAAVPARPDLREGLRRNRTRDAQVLGQRDRARRRSRTDGCRRDALALLQPAPEPAASFRLRHGRGGEAAVSHFLELRQVSRRLRKRA